MGELPFAHLLNLVIPKTYLSVEFHVLVQQRHEFSKGEKTSRGRSPQETKPWVAIKAFKDNGKTMALQQLRKKALTEWNIRE